ncbi:MAG: hypothetical protein KDJ22_16315 [Candidatus Competibacteraceae bacterium]|nr:hypothetical protein [Candidatus Competibacteraceae bacterium]MCP5127380.1 hypothetical protein [Gammaproteobacteria bacterium]
MAYPADTQGSIRVLTIGMHKGNLAQERVKFATVPGFTLIGDAMDCDDGLRQTLMTHPDVIVLPRDAPALKLLRAVAHLRDERFSPVVVIVTGVATTPSIFEVCEDIAILGAEQLDETLAERLRAVFIERQGSLLNRPIPKLVDG